MLLVKTNIGLSNIQGLGLFADEFIPKGTIVWRHDDLIDRIYHINTLNSVPDNFLWKYSWRVGLYVVVPGDDARFINHSNEPNCGEYEATGESIANRDIQIGEEITENYSSFDDDFDTYREKLI